MLQLIRQVFKDPEDKTELALLFANQVSPVCALSLSVSLSVSVSVSPPLSLPLALANSYSSI